MGGCLHAQFRHKVDANVYLAFLIDREHIVSGVLASGLEI
jgi:hypothetical protein